MRTRLRWDQEDSSRRIFPLDRQQGICIVVTECNESIVSNEGNDITSSH